ncbi:phthiocerol/phenolphthiocerol synthesis type-I polyketide synthase C [Janthinobacterium sp. CG_23.3]|uniref:SDR family NAD(P)-dependent oxidoreductase n=1 Tax=Janthinobacterium sp. CG_23.3 TaxID=3349634 RepID=UPI0038D3ADEF
MKPTSMHVDAAGADFATLLDVLAWRAEHQADQTAYIFLADGETQEIRLSYGELDKKARAIAARLIALDTGRQPVALLYPSGLDFIEALFGVLYAGAIAVPLYPPRRNRPDERLASVIKDCGARLFLTTRAVVDELPLSTQPASPLHGMRCLTTDDVPAEAAGDFPGVPRQPSATAFLQYTSGSTSTPKGVMVSHRNLMANLERIKQSCGQPDMLVVGWLPMFHDMGLISNTLEPLYVGATLVFMSPVHFLQQPIRWLRAISRYRASTSGGPNFAYELCVSKTTAVERAGLDLGRWNVAFNGAEPVRLDTLERFAAAFAPSGFRRSAFFPCYGLAEATILVASGRRGERPVSIGLDASLLLQDRVGAVAGGGDGVRVSVGCGQIADEETVLIVDPQTFSVCAPDRVGEIWVASESVAQGYWNRPAQTLETFGARLAGGDRPFLRTGDLGFVQDKELFITGRLKDLIILRGRNYYPHDIEQTMEQSHPALRHGCGAAFSQERDGEEQLVLVVEVERQHVRRLDVEALCAAVRDSVFLQHEIWPHALYLLKPGGIPKTSSGKIRRRACKEALLDGTLDVLHAWRDGTAAAPAPAAPVATAAAQAVRDWLKARVGEYAKRAAAEIDIHKPFAEYGIDSLTAVRLSGELEQHLGRRLAPTLLYDCPTIDLLANSLDAAARAPAPAPLPPPGAGAAEPIAIVGIGCRFPGAAGAAAFWTLLREQTDAITQVPPERWPVDAFYDAAPSVPGKMNTRWGGFLENIDRFDENFFGISPREAVTMDPQQRLLLETAYEALEDAGMPAAGLKASRTGVFIGICNNDYSALLSGSGGAIDPRWATGNAFSIAANRISYVFDLKGPSLAVDTACSSSLVSVHLACQSLWSGESTLALAGGVNLILKPDVTISFSAAGGTSPDGRCMAFGAQANGMVRSEGVGIVVLKPLSRALADADQIYALIPGSAVNHDGLSNGISAPNQAAQEAVIRAAFQRARRPLDQLQYVEAHGTGTLLGDPIEAHALGQVLPAGRTCAIGSVKSNIGHTEAAAGIASLIKVALALKHGRIPASLHSAVPNPYIPFDRLGLRVQRTEAAWRDQGGPHLAGVSAFGFGGTNAHVVLEQAPALGVARPAPAPRTVKLLPLSARTPEALHELVRAYLDLLEQPADALNLDALCHSAALRRDHHACRLGIVFADRDELVERLRAFLAGEMLAGVSYLPRQPGGQPKLAFVFSGHRGQAWSLSRDFLDSEPVFFDVLNQCAQLFQEYADWPLLARLCGEQGGALDPQQLDVYHPCQFAYQVALAALWRAKGVQPAAIVGHSFGEVAAAHVAGALSLADATRIIFLRSRCLRDGAAAAAGRGAMATVEMPRLEVQAILDAEAADVAIAVNNSPTSVVLSGNAASVAKLVASLKARQVFCNILDTPGAGHDQSIDVDALTRALAGIAPTSATLPLASSVLGKMIDGRDMDAAYWARNIRDAVLFADAVGALIDAACDTFIEIAPYPPVLSYAISQCLRHAKREGATLPVLRRNADEQMHLFGALGALYAQGYPLQWDRVYPAPQPFVALPTYPWQRKAFWVPAAAAAAPAAPPLAPGGHALLKQSRQFAANPGVRFWEIAVDVAAFPFFADHKVQGAIILPTTAYLEMALAAGQQVFGCNNCVLQNLVIRKALFLPERDARTLQLILTAGPEQSAAIQFFSRPQVCADDAAWTLHASIELCRAQDAAAPVSDFSAATLALDYPQTISSGEHYKVLTHKGVAYGPAFQGVNSLWLRDRETVGAVQLPAAQVNDAYLLHPALLDACLQVLAGQLHQNESALQKNDLFLPVGVGSLTVYALPPAGAALWSRALLRSAVTPDMRRVEGDVQILDQAGRVLVEVHGLALERVGFGKALAYQNADACLYDVQWDAVSREHADGASQGLPPTHWVVCGDHLLGPEIARALRGRGESCSLVLAGAEFRRTDAHCFDIDPLAPDHYALLLPQLLDDAGGRAMNILHFWSLLPASAEAGAADWWHGPCESGCLSLLQLLQALAAGQTSQRVNLSVLTRQGQALQGETVAPPQAAVWGLGKVIAFEHPELACSLVDVAADAGLDDVAELLEELRAVQGKALQVALRRHGRYEPRLRRLSLEAGAPLRGKHLPPAVNGREDETLALRADASYLVTGGLGGIGLGIAQWLCLRGARNLVLLGRSAPSDAAAAAIKVLEAAGARVHVASVDVADPAQLAGVLARIAQTMPPLRGVVHAAAVVDPGLLQNLDAGRFQSVMAPKAGGAWNLHSLTLGLPLDFFVMFSSVASLFGTPGQGNYVAANAFLDGLAYQRRALGLPALSINWGGWSQVGLVARHAGAAEIFALRGFESMTPEQGFAMLEKLLRHALPQVAVMATNWRQVCETYPQIGNMPFFAALLAAEQTGATSTGKPVSVLSRGELLAMSAQERQHCLQRHLGAHLAKSLGIAAHDIEAARPINTLGIDSLMALEIKNRIESELQVALPIVKFLEGANITEIASVLREEIERDQVVASQPAPPASAAAAALDSVQAAHMLANIDQLSDAEVDALLASIELSEGNA